MSKSNTRIVPSESNFGCENNGIWQLIDATGDDVPDLAFIKTKNTKFNTVEVHIASVSSKDGGAWLLAPSKYKCLVYAFPILPGLRIPAGFSKRGLPALVYIKTDKTSSGFVEVHTASAENTGENSIKVHVATGRSKYNEAIVHTTTDFPAKNKGFWSLALYSRLDAADLVYIKNGTTGAGMVKVHVASQSSGYREKIFKGSSSFDLAHIKNQNTAKGVVEIHVVSG
ncbi:hypothetical protein F5Y19DRAFT_461871 [Xylariaceae sp. FL1651]|nr:hypothetical protein F5Y19DRAFT_461871 [Xylariaceae sp. FL1651]